MTTQRRNPQEYRRAGPHSQSMSWLAFLEHANVLDNVHCYEQWQNAVFSRVHGTFAGMGHISGLRADLSSCKTVGLMQSLPCDHSGVEQGLKSREKTQEPGKAPGRWKWDSMLLRNTWIKKMLKEIIVHRTEWKWKQAYQNLWNAANAILRGKCIALKILHQKWGRISII